MTTRRLSPKPRPADTAALTALYGGEREPYQRAQEFYDIPDVPPNWADICYNNRKVSCLLRTWREWCRTAVVIHAAGSQ